jgi:cytochrome b561
MENSMALKSNETRFGSIAVTLHWLSFLIIAALLISGMRADDTKELADKAEILRIHAPLGISILVLTVLRILWWLMADKKPAPVAGTTNGQHKLALAVHGLLYVVILGMAASGLGMMILSGARDIIFSNNPGALPDFWDYAPRLPHAIGAKIMVGLIVLHALAALYHQFFMKDGLLRRMWY